MVLVSATVVQVSPIVIQVSATVVLISALQDSDMAAIPSSGKIVFDNQYGSGVGPPFKMDTIQFYKFSGNTLGQKVNEEGD